ncbi:hypothetical protein V1478_016864 [Vespula squamosa]|uniref:Uncharacterized protein n=1 Tax=Vespula squamosa TaxID=30214 RepID=A0ABD2A1M4_VESSQ
MKDCRKHLTVNLKRFYGIRSRSLYENLDNFITIFSVLFGFVNSSFYIGKKLTYSFKLYKTLFIILKRDHTLVHRIIISLYKNSFRNVLETYYAVQSRVD